MDEYCENLTGSENTKKNQMEQKNTVTEIKNTLEEMNGRLEEQISKLEDRVVKITQAGQKKEKKTKMNLR